MPKILGPKKKKEERRKTRMGKKHSPYRSHPEQFIQTSLRKY
jgi:hypothetical protein